jgi:hypothetical protein
MLQGHLITRFYHLHKRLDPGPELTLGEFALVHTVHLEIEHRHAYFAKACLDKSACPCALPATPVAGIDGPVNHIISGEFLQMFDPAGT